MTTRTIKLGLACTVIAMTLVGCNRYDGGCEVPDGFELIKANVQSIRKSLDLTREQICEKNVLASLSEEDLLARNSRSCLLLCTAQFGEVFAKVGTAKRAESALCADHDYWFIEVLMPRWHRAVDELAVAVDKADQCLDRHR